VPDYFSLTELRAMPQMSDTVKYPTDRCEAAAAHIVGIIERECATSFVARTRTAVLDGTGTTQVVLPSGFVRDVVAVSVDGTAVTGETFTARGGILRRYATGSTTPGTWPAGVENIDVEWLDGYSDEPPADVKEAALRGTRAYLVSTMSSSLMDDRRTSLSTEQGTISFVVPGAKNPTGYPEVDAVINAWAERLGVFGFA